MGPGGTRRNPEEPGFIFETISGFVISEQGEKLLATNKGLCSPDESNGTYMAVDRLSQTKNFVLL
ncbi:MAG: hypothetical protein GY790_04745 [Bacteroidetes bacterium]|nr:hypothetical protein [Bacteroidota bacterium]